MSMIANDRFPDVPMATQGTNSWHDDSLGDEVPAVDNIPGGQNLMTVGDDGGFEWQRARPNGTGGLPPDELPRAQQHDREAGMRQFHQTGAEYPTSVASPVTGHAVIPKGFYPGSPVRYATLYPMIFWPNPLPDFLKIRYTANIGA